MKRLFDKPQAIYAEISKMRRAEYNRREDRATVSNFFNGAPPITDAEAEELGLTINVNHLFGYTELADAREQAFSMFTKTTHQFEVGIDACPPGKRSDWEQKARDAASRVLKKITSFKAAYEGVAGDGAMHGEAVFFHPTKTFPLPKQAALSEILVPDSASTDVTELSHFAVEHDLSIHKLAKFWRKRGKRWNHEAIGALLKDTYKECLGEGRELDPENVEEAEYNRQENSASLSNRKLSVRVYYFYQKRLDKNGEPWDLDILVKQEGTLEDKDEKNSKAVLFKHECMYDNVHQLLHPFFMDCILGGKPRWHRVLGTGHLNYQLNVAIEMLINRAMQATFEGGMNIWKATNSATREDIQRILLKHNGVVPEGVELIQNRFPTNFAGMLEMIQFFRQQGSKNSRGVTPNNGDRNDQLEIQAAFEQNQGASRAGSRSSNWYDYMDRMWAETWARLTNPWIDDCEPGASEIREFQSQMERAGIPLFWLQPHNTDIRAVRIVGDGLRSKELGIATYLTQNRNQYAPEVQPKITRLVTSIVLDNPRLAEDLTPVREENETTPEQEYAQDENSRMITQRLPVQPKAADVDELHIVGHLPALETLISDALQYQNSAFTPPQAKAFELIGAHIVMHIQRIEAKAINNRNDPERMKARMFMDQLNQFAAMGDKMANNMKQAQEGQQQQVDPLEQARLQLELEKLQLQNRKLEHSVQKFERTQGNREQALAFDQMMKMEQANQQARVKERELGLRDAEVAVKVATAGKRNGNGAE